MGSFLLCLGNQVPPAVSTDAIVQVTSLPLGHGQSPDPPAGFIWHCPSGERRLLDEERGPGFPWGHHWLHKEWAHYWPVMMKSHLSSWPISDTLPVGSGGWGTCYRLVLSLDSPLNLRWQRWEWDTVSYAVFDGTGEIMVCKFFVLLCCPFLKRDQAFTGAF